jgi:BirA family biotin operon repressor/biotin-[acetyl-CoA-carboxylase] ligase
MSNQCVDIDQLWVDLKSVRGDVSRNLLAANMIERLITLLATFESTGLTPYVAQWQRLDAFSGKAVDIVNGDHKITGVCCGIAANGALIIDSGGDRKQMHGGELSLRLSDES